MEEGTPEKILNGKELTLMSYAGKLKKGLGVMIEEDVLAVRCEGASDEEILEVNQVCAYFNFSNYTLNRLGVSTKGDAIGHYQESIRFHS